MGFISANTLQMLKDVPMQRLTERRKAGDFVRKREYILCNILEKAVMDC